MLTTDSQLLISTKMTGDWSVHVTLSNQTISMLNKKINIKEKYKIQLLLQ